MVLLPCIYCRTRPASSGEHTLPAALGRFPVFDASKAFLCKAEPGVGEVGCNERLTGPAYDRLFRHGALSLYRRRLPFAVGRSAQGGGRSRGRNYEMPRIRVEGLKVDAPIEVDQGGRQARVCPGVVLDTKRGQRLVRVLGPEIRSGADLLASLGRAGLQDVAVAGIIDDQEHRIRRIVLEAFPESRLSEMPCAVLGGRLRGEMNWLAGAEKARGMATMAFHMFLQLATNMRGGERKFAGIRAVVE